VSEEIELIVKDSNCTVRGRYWFRNDDLKSANIVLFYPFVINEQLPYPDTIFVANVGSDQQVKFTRSKNGVFFDVTVQAFSTALYCVSYTQRTSTCSMQYLLQTTAQWGKPLEQALYRVRIPEKYILMSSTIRFPTMYEQKYEKVYESCKEDFMPSTDFMIQWKRGLP
jgi:hypothetical protein